MSDTPLSIALVSDWYPPAVGGVEVQVHGLARALAARGHDVHVVTTSRGDGAAADGHVHVDRLALSHLPRTRVAVPTASHYDLILNCLGARRFDVIHTHGLLSTLAMAGLRIARRLGVPSVTTHHSLIRLTHLPVARLIYIGAMNRATMVTAVSEAAARDARRASGRADVVTVPNGIELGVRSGGHGHAASDTRIVSVMRLKLKKRPYHLVRDFARVVERVSDPSAVSLTVVGDGPERRRLERLATWLGIRDRVAFRGACTPGEVASILAGSSLFIAPASAEAFGLALLEARAAGLPVVAMRRGGVPELVEHGRHGLLANSRKEFVDAVVRLVDDRPLRDRLASGSRDGLEQFSWEAVAGRYLQVYHQAMDRFGLRQPVMRA